MKPTKALTEADQMLTAKKIHLKALFDSGHAITQIDELEQHAQAWFTLGHELAKANIEHKNEYTAVCAWNGEVQIVAKSNDFEEAKQSIYSFYEQKTNAKASDFDGKVYDRNMKKVFVYEPLATCSVCGRSLPETEINMMDDDLDLCGDCEKKR